MKQNLDLGQHFMIDESLLARIVAVATLTSKDIVVEIGSGKGALTKHLYRAKPQKIICIEQDERFILPIPVQHLFGNALELITQLSFNKVVANIPYHLAEPLLIKLLLLQPEKMVLVVGKTFATKLTKNTILGLIFREAYDVQILETISSKAFFPPPKVQSALLVATLQPSALLPFLMPFYTHQGQKVKNYILSVTQGLWTKREAKKQLIVLGELQEKKLYALNTKDFLKLYHFIKTMV